MKITPIVPGATTVQAKTQPTKPVPSDIKIETKSTLPPAAEIVKPTQIDTGEGVPKGPEATDPNLDPKFANLARKEKATRQEQVKLKQEREAFLAEKADFEKSKGKSVSLEELSTNPFQTLLKAGVTYDSLVQKLLGQQPTNEAPLSPQDLKLAQAMQKIELLEEKLTKGEERQTKSQTDAYEQAVKTIRSQITTLVDADPAYETIKATGAHEEVVNFIKKWHVDNGEVLSNEEACQIIEEVALEKEMAKFKRLQETQKWKAKLTPPASEDPASPIVPVATTKTLTNSMGNARPLTTRERAMLAFKGELKN